MNNRILVLEDDPVVQNLLMEDLPSYGFEVFACSTCEQARKILQDKAVDLLLLDYRLPDGLGSDFYRSIRNDFPNTPVVFVTNYPDVEVAVNLMKEGASDYILKPFSISDVARRLHQVIDMGNLRSEVTYHRRKSLPGQTAQALIGNSPAIQGIKKAIEEVAKSPTVTVLISGETGSGKEVVARLIHQWTHGDLQPLIEVDCTTIPKTLFESELFGHEKGSFTSADRMKEGIFELAREGTIFLDEIGEITTELQARLLRVLETRQFRRVGGTRFLSFGARIIAATNRNLKDLLNRNEFRADLYYRLAVYEIKIPPLREHMEDVPLLAKHFLDLAMSRHGKNLKGFTEPFMQRLLQHRFPGNVRELRNLVEQAVIHTETEYADLTHFEPEFHHLVKKDISDSSTPSSSEVRTLLEHERAAIEAALSKSKGNKSAAARMLGISRPALLRRISKIRDYTHPDE